MIFIGVVGTLVVLLAVIITYMAGNRDGYKTGHEAGFKKGYEAKEKSWDTGYK